MKKLPYFKFYPSDFMGSGKVQMMSPAERGIYISLLCHSWQEGPLPDDPDRLARVCGATQAEMEACWPAVRRCFTVADDETLFHPRLEKERVAATVRSTRAKVAANARHAPGNAPSTPPGNAPRHAKEDAQGVAPDMPYPEAHSLRDSESTESQHTPRDEVFGNFDDLAIASIKGLYGWDDREGTDERVWGSTPTADRQRLIQIAVLRVEGEGQKYNGVFFRSVLVKVVIEQSSRVDAFAAWLAKGEAS